MGERENKRDQRQPMRALGPRESPSRHDAGPVLLLAPRNRLLQHPMLQVTRLRPGREVLLDRRQQHTLQRRVGLFDFFRGPTVVGRGLKMFDRDARSHGGGEGGEQGQRERR